MIRAMIAGLVLAAFAVSFSATIAAEKKAEKKAEVKETTTEGTVKSVDAEKGDLVITDADKKDHTFHAKEAAVTIDTKEGKLADVKAGATAKVTATGHKATKVDVTSAK